MTPEVSIYATQTERFAARDGTIKVFISSHKILTNIGETFLGHSSFSEFSLKESSSNSL
jgi:hypothetical protein